MNPVVKELSLFGIIPVIKIDDISTTLPLAKALCDGGLPCAEITFRTDAAEEAIKLITREMPDMLVGAGTVTTIEQVDKAVNAGAKFMVSPGLNPKVVKYCVDNDIPITPGTSNASDIEIALELGLEVVKFFPAEASGGIKAIKALAAPYTSMKFIPTGGINSKNLHDYLSFERILAVGGSWMVDPKLVAAGDFAAITALTREAVQNVMGFKLQHLGFNSANADESEKNAKLFCSLFGLEYKAGNSSNFAGTEFEFMKAPFLGQNGHIAIGCRSVARAIRYFEKKGFKFNADTEKFDKSGNPSVIYFADEFAGFAIHLVQYK